MSEEFLLLSPKDNNYFTASHSWASRMLKIYPEIKVSGVVPGFDNRNIQYELSEMYDGRMLPRRIGGTSCQGLFIASQEFLGKLFLVEQKQSTITTGEIIYGDGRKCDKHVSIRFLNVLNVEWVNSERDSVPTCDIPEKNCDVEVFGVYPVHLLTTKQNAIELELINDPGWESNLAKIRREP